MIAVGKPLMAILETPFFKMSYSSDQIKTAASGQWQKIYAAKSSTITSQHCIAKSTPCPYCGGKDRFFKQKSFDDSGSFGCRKCNSDGSVKNHDGIGILMEEHNWTFTQAMTEIGRVLGMEFRPAGRPTVNRQAQSPMASPDEVAKDAVNRPPALNATKGATLNGKSVRRWRDNIAKPNEGDVYRFNHQNHRMVELPQAKRKAKFEAIGEPREVVFIYSRGRWRIPVPTFLECFYSNQPKLPQPRSPDYLTPGTGDSGEVEFVTARWDVPEHKKEIRQYFQTGAGWICGHISPPRLYNLTRFDNVDGMEVTFDDRAEVCRFIDENPDMPVHITEGEVKMQALTEVGDFLVTSYPGGSNNADKVDLSPLNGYRLISFIDNDDSGEATILSLGNNARKQCPDSVLSVISVADVPDEIFKAQPGDDVHDLIKHIEGDKTGKELEEARSLIRNIINALPDRLAILEARMIEATLNELKTNDAAVVALAERGDLYERNGKICELLIVEKPGEEPKLRSQAFLVPRLREVISDAVSFYRMMKNENGEVERNVIPVPRGCAEAISARGHYPELRPLKRIVNSPVLRSDGTVAQASGYDKVSGLYLELIDTFPRVPDDPTTEQVQDAVAVLMDVVVDFPFKNVACRSAWLASLLTPLAREAYTGCTGPLFLFDANTRGSGKTLLADINGFVITGASLARFTAPKDDEECRKRITALVMDSDEIVLIDNIDGRFGSAALDAALTGTTWKDRILGSSQTVEAPLLMTWYGSGNNVILQADTSRRVCHIRLESPLENPEDRDGFKHQDVKKHVRENRPELLTAALTILRGYIAAGKPDQKLKPWGSYENWSDLVRGAIVWAGLPDPGETRDELRETADSEAGGLIQILEAIELFDPNREGIKAIDMISLAQSLQNPNSSEAIRRDAMLEAIQTFCDRDILRVNSRFLGTMLGKFRSRVSGGLLLKRKTVNGSAHWTSVRVDQVDQGGSFSAPLRGQEKQQQKFTYEDNSTTKNTPVRSGPESIHPDQLDQLDPPGSSQDAYLDKLDEELLGE